MELDEFKTIFRQQHLAPAPKISVPDIERIIRRKAQSVLDQVVRNIWMEMIVCVVFAGCMAALLLATSTWYIGFFAGFMFLYAVFFLYYLYSLKQKIRFLHANPSISQNLRQVIIILSGFKNAYFQGTMVMIPVLLVTAFIYGLSGGREVVISLRTFLQSRDAWKFLVISAAWYAMMYFFTRWYTRKLYGKHLVSLRLQLNELEN